MPLFETDHNRITNNLEMYELSLVPEHLSGGGGWSIKKFSLEGLYAEHEYCRNSWSHTNKDLPLCRYTGCTIKLFQSSNADYIFSYSTQMPMTSSLPMYQSMQPSILQMLPQHIIVPSRRTYPKKKPYIKLKIKPPKPFMNKWYFQADMTKTPLLLTRASATSLQDYYINPNSTSTNITIPILNTGLFKNRNFKTPANPGYSPTGVGTSQVWLYSTDVIPTSGQTWDNPDSWLNWGDVIPLFDSNTYTEGTSYNEYKKTHTGITPETWKTTWFANRGNPFHDRYLGNESKVWQSTQSYSNNIQDTTFPNKKVTNFTLVDIVQYVRYNPYADHGKDNQAYFLSIAKNETGWDPPEKPELITTGLPLWLLLFGFADWQKKLKKLLHLDTEYALVLQTQMTYPIKKPLVMLNPSMLEGHSPEDTTVHPDDLKIWHPQFQFQQLIYNELCASGPGIIRLNKGQTVEGVMQYSFYFKWGGNPPPMDTIADPGEQPSYPIPRNELNTNSLQNPSTDPATFLWQFDERRGQITDKAAKRLQRDYQTKTTFITDGKSHLSPEIHQETQQTSEESSEEEEEETSLLLKLQQQYVKQRQLKYRILKTMTKLQKLE